jgi:hypothetical protein
MHRHRDSHGVTRSLTEHGCAAANEKSARQAGCEPETFHDSDELTNFDTKAQHKVRQRHCSEGSADDSSVLHCKKESSRRCVN